MIQSHFDYCITVWGFTTKKNILFLQRLQNRCARAVTGQFDYTVSASSLIHNLGWMTIEERRFYFTSCLVYKCLNNSAPSYLSNRFTYSLMSRINIIMICYFHIHSKKFSNTLLLFTALKFGTVFLII